MSAYIGPPSGGVVRQPILRLKAGGVVIPRPIEAVVTSTNTWTAARWAATIAMTDTDIMNAAWFSLQSDIRIDVDVSLDNGVTFTNIVSGITDEIEISPDANQVTISGRDYTALLIDQKTADTYQNQTSSDVAKILAGKVGLTPVVTDTKTNIGTYYANDAVRMSMGDLSRAITYWDLLIYLAQQENFDVFVQGQSLYFQPMATASTPPFEVQWSRVGGVSTGNVIGLSLKRSLTLAKDVSVTVKSWNSALRKAVTAQAKSAANGSSEKGAAQTYVFYQPNLTPSQVADYANQKLVEISRHEKVISFDCPGELSLTPRGVIRLSGTATGFDQLYYPDSITRGIDALQGFTQSVTARNHSPVDQVALATGGGKTISGLGF